MSQPTRQPKRRAHSTKKARTKSTSQPQALLDPPQIRKFIRRYFRAQPERGDALWSLILGDDDLLKAWKVYAKAGIGQDFWEARWRRDLELGADEWSAVSEMHQNRHHLMRLCHYSLILSLACDVFAAIDSLPEDKAAQVSHLEDALLSHAGEKMGELMDAGCSAAEFWPPESRWIHHGWDDAAVRLAGARDPMRVAQWVADANPLVAERCLTENGHNLKELDPAVLDLGDIAVRALAAVPDSEISFDRPDRHLASLSALIAILAHPDRPISMDRLAYVIARFVPNLFHPATYDWLTIIDDEHLYGFFDSLLYSIDTLRVCAEQYPGLKPEDRAKPLILHIDDEKGMRVLIAIMFTRSFGERLITVSTIGGGGALILASMLLPDLVLTDIMEPGIDGLTFAAYLKKNPITQKVPFIFLTARGDPESVKIAMELGAADYLTKPILHKDLTALIENVMGLEAQPSK